MAQATTLWLPRLTARHPMIREDRGVGLLTGVETEEEGATAPASLGGLIDLAFRRGLLLLCCGQSTIRFCPP